MDPAGTIIATIMKHVPGATEAYHVQYFSGCRELVSGASEEFQVEVRDLGGEGVHAGLYRYEVIVSAGGKRAAATGAASVEEALANLPWRDLAPGR